MKTAPRITSGRSLRASLGALCAVLCVCATPSRAPAQGWVERLQKVSSHVTVHVNGRIASVEVEEQFRNDGPALGQADYLYPLPGEAVFSNFSLFQGDQELRGETLDANHARSIYEAIVRQKRDPALIELAGHGLLRARVFPIASGETRKITLRYTQVLTRSGDAVQFSYAASPQSSGMARTPVTFRLILDDAASYSQPFSPTHELQVQRANNRITVTPRSAFVGDFNVFMPLRSQLASVTVATHRPSSEDGFFMLTLTPGEVREAGAPRDITAVVDVSGSMSGEKIEQARAALHSLLSSLSPRDRFRLIAFSDMVRTYNPEWLNATRENTRAADAWVDDLRPGGGTNIAGALREAFAANSGVERLPFVVFVTDGLPSVGESNPEIIADMAEHRRGRTRVFAFGVGYDVNTYLLDRLSSAAHGSTQYVKPGESVERAVSSLATKIRFPVFTDLRIANAPVRIEEVYPRNLPDLFAGEEMIVVGRYSGSGSGRLVVSGRRGAASQSVSANVDFQTHELGNEFIPKLWASRKVGYLSQQIRLRGQNQELVDELRETALRYGILSEYTSYLVQEPPSPPVMAPAAFSGQGAVVAAEAARNRREAKTVAAAQAADMAGAGRVLSNAAPVRSGVDVVEIAPFSDAYFALVRALPELKAFWRTTTNAVVDGKRIRIKVSDTGVKELSATRIDAIVKQFRI